MTSTTGASLGELDSPADVLVFARERHAAANRAQADLLTAAVTWAEQHPPESIGEEATWITPAGDTGIPIAGEGAPLVAEFCIAEFALAIGRSTDAGRSVVADSVELKYRLGRIWARVQSGDLEPWRARRIAQETLGLTREAAAFVDAQVAPFAHRIGIAALERPVAEAIARFMPDRAAEDARNAADGRHFTIEHHQVSFNGTSQITGELDLADALDLDAAVSQGAEALRALGSTESLDVRRSIAAGQIARNQLALDLAPETDADTATTRWSSSERSERTDETTTPNKGTKPRQVVLYVHLSEAAITGSSGLELARVENQRQVITADQIKVWCANPDAQVTVKPVIDLNEHIHVEGYEVPARLREQVILRDHSCVFPWCTQSARKTDADHVIPYAEGGTTSSDNIAPLCRRHHRLKTPSMSGVPVSA
jgi:5-methylcytosine-specific restriction endonuclease McrA